MISVGIEEAIKFVKEMNEESRQRRIQEDNSKIEDFLLFLEQHDKKTSHQ